MKKSNVLTSLLCAAALISGSITAALPVQAADAGVTTFTFSESGIAVSNAVDSNYSIDGTALTISGKGSYRVTGSCSSGSIKVNKNVSGVTLTLADLTLSNTTAPLCCNKNSQADIIIEGTVSLEDTVENSEDYWTDLADQSTDSDYTAEIDAAENAVVKLKGASKITISGDGTLNIKANAKNGIKSGSTLDSTLENELAPDPTSDYYAYLTMSDLTVNIDTTSVYTPKSSSSQNTGGQNFDPRGGGIQQQEQDYYGDAINAECCLNVRSGTYNIDAGDDGIKSDYYLNIGSLGAENNALDININRSNEGLEGAVVNIYSGDIDITAGDDAINAANGDLSQYNFELNIYGGDIYADASSGNDNDALDSNGSITVYGGRTIALADRSGNAFDLEGSFTVNGGSLLGLGIAPMEGEKLNNSSKQTWAIWSSGGGFGGFGGFGGRGGNQGGASTNISSADQSKVTLTAGNASYAVGSSFSGISQGSEVAVMLNGSEEIISTTAKVNATYVTFAGDINGTTQSTLTYSANDGSDKTTAVTADTESSLTIAANTFENSGSVFKEWNTQSDGMGVSYSSGDSFLIPCSTTLYAIWESESSSDTDSEAETEPFTGTFAVNGGKAAITTYDTQDYTKGNANQTTAFARDSATGSILSDGNGQINFTVIPEDGYTVASVTATEGTYKNIKNVTDAGVDNTYRITKITGDLTITITLEKAADTDVSSETDTDSQADTDTQIQPSDSDIPTPPTDDSDRPTPPSWDDSDRPTPPDWDDSDRPTPPGWDDSDRPTPPADDSDVPTPPEDNSDSDVPTPPEDNSDSDVPTPPEDNSDSDVPTPPEETPDEPIKLLFGDASGDGVIKSNDALLVLRHSAKLTDLAADDLNTLIVSDVNHDGKITSADALLILRYSANIRGDDSWAGQYKELSSLDLSVYDSYRKN